MLRGWQLELLIPSVCSSNIHVTANFLLVRRSTAQAHIATAGDPRRPSEVVKYVPNEPDEQQMPSLMLLAALGCGMIAVFAKIKYFSLAALFCIASAVAKWNSSTDIKMVLHSLACGSGSCGVRRAAVGSAVVGCDLRAPGIAHD
ncbi:uncharacterized protein HaLaN_23276, partial [Haematococcus lacustris]